MKIDKKIITEKQKSLEVLQRMRPFPYKVGMNNELISMIKSLNTEQHVFELNELACFN